MSRRKDGKHRENNPDPRFLQRIQEHHDLNEEDEDVPLWLEKVRAKKF